MPDMNEAVHVWPRPGANVRSHAELDRRLPPEGIDLPWSPWLEEMHGQGLVYLTNPAPKPATAKAEVK